MLKGPRVHLARRGKHEPFELRLVTCAVECTNEHRYVVPEHSLWPLENLRHSDDRSEMEDVVVVRGRI